MIGCICAGVIAQPMRSFTGCASASGAAHSAASRQKRARIRRIMGSSSICALSWTRGPAPLRGDGLVAHQGPDLVMLGFDEMLVILVELGVDQRLDAARPR